VHRLTKYVVKISFEIWHCFKILHVVLIMTADQDRSWLTLAPGHSGNCSILHK